MLTTEQIDEALTSLPSLIARKAEEAEESRIMFDKEKIALDNEGAKLLLQFKAEDLKLTVVQAEAKAENALYQKRLILVEVESRAKKKKILVDELSDKLTSMRAIVKLRVAEMYGVDKDVGRE